MKRKLPPNVYKDRSRYAYKPYLGRENGKRVYGRPIRLCGLDASIAQVWAEYEKVVKDDQGTLKWLLAQYHDSQQFRRLAKATREGYESYRGVICRQELKSGGTFGDVPLKAITRRTIRRYLDKYPHPISANRHIQYLKAAWNWGLQRYETVPDPNPCLGVDMNEETPRPRYVTHEEYRLVRDIALGMRVPYFAHAMELAYLCRARRAEVFGLRHEDLTGEGIMLRRSKGSRGEITLWNPRLRAAVEGCKSIYPNAPTPITGKLLIHNKSGGPMSKNALDSAWQRIMAKAMDTAADQHLSESFTFHDLKAAGCTDHDDQNAGGHKSKKMIAVYDRLPRKVKAIE